MQVLGHSLVRSLVHTAHSFACSALLTSLAHSAALTRSLAPLHSLARSLTSLIPELVGK